MSREGDVDESKRATLRRFAALGATSPLVGLAKESESDAPGALLGYVAATPGAHFSKIRDDLQLGTGETQHHLRRLEREGTVESREDGEYRRYFPADRFSEFEQVALGYLRRETPRGMVVALLRDPEASGTALAEQLGVSAPTVSKYASQLEDAGLISRERGYQLERPETLLLLLVQHADSFGPEAAELAADADDIVSYDP
ncbi:winged helix-turn-helix transcriptional regulator [Halosimplex salinum]|uniref:winged helix-turn-helix transcriptional regulator n=1 Tax=Halosimplex salinum TaxID=1710538 RepID=UPI000F4A35A2|nr:winged helix-turn-helix transcriptional regulator [Halosimplex salinum]